MLVSGRVSVCHIFDRVCCISRGLLASTVTHYIETFFQQLESNRNGTEKHQPSIRTFFSGSYLQSSWELTYPTMQKITFENDDFPPTSRLLGDVLVPRRVPYIPGKNWMFPQNFRVSKSEWPIQWNSWFKPRSLNSIGFHWKKHDLNCTN